MSNLYRGPSIDASYQVSIQPQANLISDWLISKKIFSSVKRKITLAIISLRN
jgi:hypothetical protein